VNEPPAALRPNWRIFFKPGMITGAWPAFPLLVLFGLNAVDEFDRVAFAVLLPEIRDAFNLSTAGILGLVALLTPIAILLGLPIAHYADRWRRTRMAAAGAAAWSVFSFMSGLAPFVWVLGIARAGSGIGKAVNDPTHNSLLADYYPPEVRANVYYVHRFANSVGQFVAPAVAGVLAVRFSWRAPFLVFALPTLVLVFLALRLREPVRGYWDRRAVGASEETALVEESPVSFEESWRTLMGVKTFRRVAIALPLLSASLIGIGNFLSLFWNDVYALNAAQRGFLASATEPVQMVGILIGVTLAVPLMERDPGLMLRGLGVTAVGVAACLTGIAFSPTLWVAVGFTMVQALLSAILVPGIYAAASYMHPPRTRSMGFSAISVFTLPGLIALPVIGQIGEVLGLRVAILTLIPGYLIGSFVVASAGRFLRSDISRVRASSAAQAEARLARQQGRAKMLIIRDLDVSYVGVQVLFGVNLEVGDGEIVALLGTNGAGKTTLLRAISGLVEPEGGAIVFDGRDVTMSDPVTTSKLGITQMPGGRAVFPTLTVAENLRLAGWLYQRDASYVTSATEGVLALFPVLRERLDQMAGNLSGGEQQMLALAQVFIAKPKLLMIDELTLGLAPAVVEQLLEMVRTIHARGTTVILVEQSVNVALTLANTAYFMEKGEIRFHGPTAELLERKDVLRSVFLEGAASVDGAGNGRSRKSARVRRAPGEPSQDVALRARELTKSFGGVRAVHDLSFDLRAGEILGIIGPNGAGKTTLFDLLSGYLAADEGSVELAGRDISRLPPYSRARLGLGRSFQEARLFPSLTVAETVAVALDRTVGVKDPIATALNVPEVSQSEARVRDRAAEIIELMGLAVFRDKLIWELSTGTRRLVDLACIVALEPSVLLLDEPSSGIAQRETEALGPVLLRLRETTGASLLVIEHDMPLITSISDEMLALDLGRVVTRGTPHDVIGHPRVVESYLGSSEAAIARSGSRPRKRRRAPVT
jgi:branched-chain amino acid transport system ATP-binding protein